jgi:translation initiation factor 4E
MSQKEEELKTSENINDEDDHEEEEDDVDRDVDLRVKHDLQHTWTLWYDNPSKKTTTHTYETFLKKVYTFDTVCFSLLFSNIPGRRFLERLQPHQEAINHSKRK